MRTRAPGVTLIRRKNKNPKLTKPIDYWILRWPDSTGKTRTENIGRCDRMTAAEAGELRRRKLVGLETGTALRDRNRMTLAEFLDMDRESIRTDCKPGTIASYRKVRNQAVAALGDPPIEKVTWWHVAKLKAWLGAEHKMNGRMMPPCRPATIRAAVVTLKAVWNRGVKRGLVADNPFAHERLGKIQQKQRRIFRADEIAAMVEAAPDAWWRAFIRLGFSTGLRLGEMLSLTWDDVDLTSLLGEGIRDVRGLADEKNIDLQVVLPAKVSPIRGDRDKLAVVVNNLLGNAIKYTPADGAIVVACRFSEDAVTLTVKDNGIGIAPKDHARIFEKFQRADDEDVSAIPGTGIGLYTAREIARCHGGEIDLLSEKGKGSTFIVKLPLQASRATSLTTRVGE